MVVVGTMVVPSEDAEQSVLFDWAEMAKGRYPELAWMYAVPNGGYRHIQTAAKLKKTGVKKGVPDVFLPAPRAGYHGLYIEMKRKRGGVISVDQRRYMDFLTAQGYRCLLCRGADEAIENIKVYLNLPKDSQKRN